MKLSLKWRLTGMVCIVLLLVATVLFIAISSLIESLDSKLIEAISARAQANAKAVGAEIAFEIAARVEDDAKQKIHAFKEAHSETHAIAVLDAKNATFTTVGEQIDPQRLGKLFPSLAVGATKTEGNLVVAVAPIEAEENENETAGCVIYTESLKEYNDIKKRVQIIGTGGMFAGVIFIMVIVYFIGRTTARPITKLVEAAERIAAGNLSEITVEAGSTLETNRLAVAVQQMAGALQKQVSAIKSLTSDVTTLSKEAATAIAHLASSASEQAAAVAETASTVEEMEQAGKSAAGNASQIAEASGKTTEASIRGRQAVETTSDIILRIKDDSQEISDKSKNLLSSVEEIGNIISSVNGIAEQSKILAVNASIEAAKAGEYGMGFAVVAQEVKDLAQQSKEATLQITGTLTAIRQAIEVMVDTAQSGARRTEDGVKMVGNAGAIVNDLSEAIRENSEFANVIATNVSQQTLGLTQIATAIEEINSTALENQEISKKIEGSTKQMASRMDKLSGLVGRWKTSD